MTALLLEIKTGDEVIMPSYTFVSTANAFVLRGAKPVFVDVREDTLNIDEGLIEAAISPRTRAIVPVHYAGVGCEMDTITQIAATNGLKVVEDAAQGVMATYKGRALGSIGHLGAYSFHETKNLISGEGGALLVNSPDLIGMAEIYREKGTDRSRFFAEKWINTPGRRLVHLIFQESWSRHFFARSSKKPTVSPLRASRPGTVITNFLNLLSRLDISAADRAAECRHNAHMYYILLPPRVDRQTVLSEMRRRGISAIFHYVPLHSSPAGLRYCRTSGELPVTDSVSRRLIRLPLWMGISYEQQVRVVKTLAGVIKDNLSPSGVVRKRS